MPTKHRRIAIVRDADVERALQTAREGGDKSRSDAAVTRELVLRGAEAVEAARGGAWERKLAREHGATPARGSIRELLDRLGPPPEVDPENPHPATKILDELREDRL
jgi:hypothetical protein